MGIDIRDDKSSCSQLTLDTEMIWKHIVTLCKFTDRIAGTDNIEKASNYIVNCLEKLEGVKVWVDRFYFLTSYPEYSNFEIIEPELREIDSFPNLFSENTSPEGITGEIVYVGSGDEESYQNRDVAGKLVLAELSYSPPRTEKARIASLNKAKALIIMNWGHKENHVVGKGAIKGVWGPPTLEDIEKIPKIISLNISRRDGEYIKKLLTKQKVKARIKVKVRNRWVCSNQPMCRIDPSNSQHMNELIIVGGHLEAWGGTATDNSSGNAVMLEMIRTLVKNRDKILRSIVFGFWDGHEIGEAAGSSWFVYNHWQELKEKGVVYINIDACGLAGASRFVSYSSPETWSFLEEVEKDVIGKPSEKKLPLKFGDNSFLGIGIPYVFTFATYTDTELKDLGGAIFGWWYHSEEDTIDKIDKDVLRTQAELYLEYVLRLACQPMIPFDFTQFIMLIKSEITELKKVFPIELTDTYLSRIEVKTSELEKLIHIVNEMIDECRNGERTVPVTSINKLLLSLSRVMIPAFRSTVDRYSHDVYGNVFLQKPLPRIYRVLSMLAKASNNECLQNALKIDLIREFNIINDAITDATNICKMFLSSISGR